MSGGRWFANRGQIIQTICACVSACVALVALYFVLKSNNSLPKASVVLYVSGAISLLLTGVVIGRRSASRTAQDAKKLVIDVATAEPMEQSASLGRLPVYRQDLEINLLGLVVGTAIGGNATVFMQVKFWARTALNIVKMTVRMTTTDGTHQATILTSLSEWLLVEDVMDSHKRMNHKDTNLETLSLLREIEGGIFLEGHHEPRWIGCEVPVPFLRPEDIKALTIVIQDKQGVLKREIYREWPPTESRVIDAAFRRS
jgi:hypothetical protein